MIRDEAILYTVSKKSINATFYFTKFLVYNLLQSRLDSFFKVFHCGASGQNIKTGGNI